jgi:hypothetical protein
VFDWLFEGRSEIYWLLGLIAVVLLLVWWRTRKRNFLLAAAAVASLAGVYYVLDRLVETPREQIVRSLHEMADAVKARNAEAIFKHIAKDFKFRSQDRTGFRAYVERALTVGAVDDLVIYDESWPDGGDDKVRPVRFYAKPKSSMLGDQPAYPVEAKFVREADGQWRMREFEIYNPVAGKNPMDIPSLP